MAQPSPSYKAQPRKPRLTLPPGACNTHFHVIGEYAPTEAERKRLLVDSPQRLYGVAA
jgi:hypothetical protein